MFDFRTQKELIRSEVRKLNDADENWKWSVEAINKTEVRIKWGYLDWLSSGHFFSLGIKDWSEEDDEVEPGDVIVVTGGYDRDTRYFKEFVRYVGLEFVEETFEDAIRMAIDSIAYNAHTRW